MKKSNQLILDTFRNREESGCMSLLIKDGKGKEVIEIIDVPA